MSGGVFVTVRVGRAGTAAANVRYMTRERATEGEQERVWTQNVPEYADHPDHAERGISYKERTADLREYARQLEEDEQERPQRGSGEKRTHYRAIYSFDREVTDEKAREMVDKHLAENFPNARAIAALHRDTDNTHVHVQIAARGTDDKKLHFNKHTHSRLDERWARIYGAEFGREIEQEHAAKKEMWRAWMREARQAKLEGREIPPRPQRVAHERNQVEERRKMHAKQYGLEYADQTRARDDQRRTVERAAATEEREQPATERVPGSFAADRQPASATHELEPSVSDTHAEHRQLRTADRAVSDETRRSDRDDGASRDASRRQNAGDGRAHGFTGSDHQAATSQTRQVLDVTRFSTPANDTAARRDHTGHREPDRHADDARVADIGDHRADRDSDEHRRDLRDQDDIRAGRTDHRAKPELGIVLGNDDAGDANQNYRERESQTAATRTRERPGAGEHTPASISHTEPDAGRSADAHTAQQKNQTLTHEPKGTAADVMRLMTEATRPTVEREGRERAAREAAERARIAAERERAEAAAREQARAQAAREQQERQVAKERQAKALEAANRTVERELHGMMKDHGREVLRDSQTPSRLAQTLERTLGEHDTKLSEIGLTRKELGEQVKAYVERIGENPEGFMRWMEPSRVQQQREQPERAQPERERSRDRGYGFSR